MLFVWLSLFHLHKSHKIAVCGWVSLFQLQKPQTSRCACIAIVTSIIEITQITLILYAYCYFNYRTHKSRDAFIWLLLFQLQKSTKWQSLCDLCYSDCRNHWHLNIFVWCAFIQLQQPHKYYCICMILCHLNHRTHENNVFVWFAFITLSWHSRHNLHIKTSCSSACAKSAAAAQAKPKRRWTAGQADHREHYQTRMPRCPDDIICQAHSETWWKSLSYYNWSMPLFAAACSAPVFPPSFEAGPTTVTYRTYLMETNRRPTSNVRNVLAPRWPLAPLAEGCCPFASWHGGHLSTWPHGHLQLRARWRAHKSQTTRPPNKGGGSQCSRSISLCALLLHVV